MNFINEFMRIFATFTVVCFFSIFAHIALCLWQIFPIEEEKSAPIYITKELYNK